MNILLIIAILLGLGAATVGVLFATGVLKIKSQSKTDKSDKSKTDKNELRDGKKPPECGPDGNNYISPKPFGVGYINEPRHANANTCSNKPVFGYAIQQPYVKYGLPKISDDCLCTEFVQAP